MQEKVYQFQIGRLLKPALAFWLLCPILPVLWRLGQLPARYGMILTLIYIAAAIALVVILVFARSQRVLIEDDKLTFRSLLSSATLEPADISRINFRKLRRRGEVILVRAGGKTYLLSDFYSPFEELSIDIRELVERRQIRSNLYPDR
ncbi:MAG: hypothetical protein LBS10_02040 [Gracilibacteraceae bacterium]|jgi:hypothetical protein|nr:hypothetical protein [Gracilibacteraceae bacterium]